MQVLHIYIYTHTNILPFVFFGCETWSLTLREERRMKVFENRVLMRIFGPKRDEVTGEWRKLHNEEIVPYSSPNTVRVIKSRIWWAGHVARMGKSRGVYRVLVLKPVGKRPWEDPGGDGRMILIWIFRMWDLGLWTDSSWLRIETGGGHLWIRWWSFGFHKMRGISWLTANRLASQ